MRSTNLPYPAYHIAAQALSLATVGIASLVLIGWAFGILTPASLVPRFAEMKIMTAFGFIFAGASVLWLNATRYGAETSGQSRHILAALPAVVAGLMGLGTLISYAFNIVPETTDHARMSLPAAVSFILFVVAMVTFVSETRGVQRISEAAVLLMVWISGLVVHP